VLPLHLQRAIQECAPDRDDLIEIVMEAKGVLVYVLQHNAVPQIQKHLAAIFKTDA